MNVARAIELAFASVIRTYGELGEGVSVRAWQSLEADNSWTPENDRTFPMVDIRCSPPRVDDNQRTLYADVAIMCFTKTDDDLSHSQIQKLYGAVQDTCDALFSQSINVAGAQFTEFLAVLIGETYEGANFGGFSWGDGLVPYDDSGLNAISISMRVHYSRADY